MVSNEKRFKLFKTFKSFQNRTLTDQEGKLSGESRREEKD